MTSDIAAFEQLDLPAAAAERIAAKVMAEIRPELNAPKICAKCRLEIQGTRYRVANDGARFHLRCWSTK